MQQGTSNRSVGFRALIATPKLIRRVESLVFRLVVLKARFAGSRNQLGLRRWRGKKWLSGGLWR
jgi:hypothetical protein